MAVGTKGSLFCTVVYNLQGQDSKLFLVSDPEAKVTRLAQ